MQSKNLKPGHDKMSTRGVDDFRLVAVSDLLATAHEVVKAAELESVVLDRGVEDRVPRFSDHEVAIGGIIGRGGFCIVRDINEIRFAARSVSTHSNSSRGNTTKSTDENGNRGASSISFNKKNSDEGCELSDSCKSLEGRFLQSNFDGACKYTRESVAQQSRKGRRRGGRFVLKVLDKDVDKITYMKGNVDIAMEAKFLAVLSHPNIIDLVGMSESRPCTPGFFLILEKMTETLNDRIKKWMDRERMCKGIIGQLSGGKRKQAELYHERIAASYDIANGLNYLHSKHIVYRDLKPANVGFDYRDQLKLFDFGLAKELKEKDLRQDGTYRNMTAMTGAVRYMAPEVGLGQSYNLSADVYSWAMVMWFTLALEPPFGFFSEGMIVRRVHRKGVRPAIFKRWKSTIGEMLQSAWDPDLHNRPSFSEITLVLQQELRDTELAGSRGTDVTDQGAISQGEDSEASKASRQK